MEIDFFCPLCLTFLLLVMKQLVSLHYDQDGEKVRFSYEVNIL